MFLITDSYGTRQIAWTMSGALSWLAVCSPDAVITNRFTGKRVAARYFTHA